MHAMLAALWWRYPPNALVKLRDPHPPSVNCKVRVGPYTIASEASEQTASMGADGKGRR